MRVAVVGAGAAGTAAAWGLARGGAEVLLVHARPGATELYSGALDLDPQTDEDTGDLTEAELDCEVREFATAIGIWHVPPGGCRVATSAGVVRSVWGIDVGLLDLAPLAGKRIAVADAPRDGWDAQWLAQSLAAAPWAQRTRTEFVPTTVALSSNAAELHQGSYDFAHLFDDEAKMDHLAEQLERADAACAGWLVGPWLGVEPASVARLRARTRLPVGEVSASLDGPAGARFARAREALLASSNVEVRPGKVASLEQRSSAWEIDVEQHGRETVHAVVLAVGGLISGGVMLAGSACEPGRASSFRLSLEAPVRFALDRRELDSTSTLHGIDVQPLGAPALERVGVSTHGPRVPDHRGLFVAGSTLADRPRTALEAARSGLAAAHAALE
jgi:anaerobic glycerol-3-phosphate dehydrogenase